MSGQPSSIAGIILAAGMSTRFGGNKLLADYQRRPIIRWVAEAALASQLTQILVVLGHQAVAVGDALADLPIDTVVNQDYQHGQSTSVISGLKAVQTNYSAAMYLMGDQPLIETAIIDELITAYVKSEHDICYPSFQNKRRNPVIFGDVFFDDILALTGDTGARAIIDANPGRALAIGFNHEQSFLDVDEEIDLNSLHSTGTN